MAIYEAEEHGLECRFVNEHPRTSPAVAMRTCCTPASYVEWTVTSRAAGPATLALRYARPESDSTGELRVNGAVVAAALPLPTTDEWSIWGQSGDVPVTLPVGESVVRFTYLGPYAIHVDHLRVTWSDDNARNAPPRFRTVPVWNPPAFAGRAYAVSLALDVEDPDVGDTMTYAFDGTAPTWLTITSDGLLSGTPVLADVGIHTVVVRLTDSLGASAKGTVHISVGRVTRRSGMATAIRRATTSTTVPRRPTRSSATMTPTASATLAIRKTADWPSSGCRSVSVERMQT